MHSILLTTFAIFFAILSKENAFSNEKQTFSFKCSIDLKVKKEKKWQNRVYLATYPRSGNHWMRYLIEEATHIATSSCYQDPDPQHMATVFPWGGYCCEHGYEGQSSYATEQETVVIKTHFPAIGISPFDELPYTKTIRIVRHPVDSFYSFYIWVQTYSNQPCEYAMPKDVLLKSIASWRAFQNYWDQAENVLTVRYEDLYNHPEHYLRQILNAIGYQVTEADIQRAVAKFPPRGGLYKHFDHFSAEDLALIQAELGPLMQKSGYSCQ